MVLYLLFDYLSVTHARRHIFFKQFTKRQMFYFYFFYVSCGQEKKLVTSQFVNVPGKLGFPTVSIYRTLMFDYFPVFDIIKV